MTNNATCSCETVLSDRSRFVPRNEFDQLQAHVAELSLAATGQHLVGPVTSVIADVRFMRNRAEQNERDLAHARLRARRVDAQALVLATVIRELLDVVPAELAAKARLTLDNGDGPDTADTLVADQVRQPGERRAA